MKENRSRRFISLFLAFVLACSHAGTAFAESSSTYYEEVPSEFYDEGLVGESGAESYEEAEPAEPESAGDAPVEEAVETDDGAWIEPDSEGDASYEEPSDTEYAVEEPEAYEPEEILPDDGTVEGEGVSDELLYQTLDIEPYVATLYKKKKQPTAFLSDLQQLWHWIFNKDAVPVPSPDEENTSQTDEEDEELYDIGYEYENEFEYENEYAGTYGHAFEDNPLTLRVSGYFPAWVTAEAKYIQFTEPGIEQEKPLYAVELNFYDVKGDSYKIRDDVNKISVELGGSIISDELHNDAEFVVYSYKEDKNKEKKTNRFAADVTVFRNVNADPNVYPVQYTPGMTGDDVVIYEDSQGSALYQDENRHNMLGFAAEEMPLHFVLSAIRPEAVVAQLKEEAAMLAAEEAEESTA